MATYKVTCSRCLGTGRYDRGTCFRCKGACYTTTTRKPAPRSLSWNVWANERESGAPIKVFRVGAKDKSTALSKARATLARGNSYDPSTAIVERAYQRHA